MATRQRPTRRLGLGLRVQSSEDSAEDDVQDPDEAMAPAAPGRRGARGARAAAAPPRKKRAASRRVERLEDDDDEAPPLTAPTAPSAAATSMRTGARQRAGRLRPPWPSRTAWHSPRDLRDYRASGEGGASRCRRRFQ